MTHRYSGSLSLPIRPMNPTPKHRPTAISPTISEPCKAATRGLFKLESRAINPKKDTIPPTIRLRLRMLFSPVRSSCQHYRPRFTQV